MQQTSSMNLAEGFITAASAAAVGWLASSLTKVSKSEFKELVKRIDENVVKRIDILEKDLTGRMTRAEFEQAFTRVEALVKEFRNEAKAEFKELKLELKTKT